MEKHNVQNFKKILLASKSPRRSHLLSSAGVEFEKVDINVEEVYPSNLPIEEIPLYLAKLKSHGYNKMIQSNEILLTADTVVLKDGEVLEKPLSLDHAKEMIRKINGDEHTVITGVCLKSHKQEFVFSERTVVKFYELSEKEIDFYINKFKPLDKTGAYGVQEWIGHIGIKEIKGSYDNVVGLPVGRLYFELKKNNLFLA